MIKNLLKNYNATICEIKMQASSNNGVPKGVELLTFKYWENISKVK